MTRPIQVEIHRAAIRHNYLLSRAQAPQSKAYAVLKANAYGHGLLDAVQALTDVADGFALLNIEDAVRLREAGVQQDIVLLEGAFDAEEAAAMAHYRLGGAIHSQQQISWLAKGSAKHPVSCWLKINSGMNRLGFTPAEAAPALAQLRALPGVRLDALMTHFATADDDYGVAEQWGRFQPLIAPSALPVSAANSAALFRHPHTHGAVVRPGIVLYGCSPFADVDGAGLGLQAAMTLSSRVIAVQKVPAGDAVGYGRRLVAEGEMRVGIVACGYADGYPRIADNGTPVAVDGQPTGTVGRVSMDMLAVDLSKLPQAGVGSRVELWGPQVPIERVAAGADTLGYELMCAVAPRVPRLVHN